MDRPNCFDTDAQFDEYMAMLLKAVDVPDDQRHFCFDCTPDHQHQMMQEGRCEYPENATKFVLMDIMGEKSLQGIRF